MDKKIFKVKGTYVNGQWLNSKDRYDIYNPSNGEKLSDVPLSDKKELELAVDSAKKAQLIWSKTSLIERANALEKLAKKILEKEEEFALIDTYDSGNALTGMRKDVKETVNNIRYFCGLVREVKGETFSMEKKPLKFYTLSTLWCST